MSDISDEGVEVPEIMRKLRERMSRQRPPNQPSEEIYDFSDIDQKLDRIRSEWDVLNRSYQIHSHRPYARKILVKGRELVHGEVQRYVDPMFYKQMEFNRNISSILDQLTAKMGNNGKNLADATTAIQDQIDSIRTEMDCMIDKKINLLMGELKEDIENKAWLASIIDRRKASDIFLDEDHSQEPEINYFLFEERFRGPREDVKEKQQGFVHYFLKCRNVLDIGCGRGEFLELLSENAIEAKGIDIDPNMISYCRSKGLNVEMKDAISYLSTLEDKALDGIFLDQVVEHLEPEYLVKLLDICHKKLNYGYFIIIETVNPLSLFSFINFYIDMTHKKPLHPNTLKFLLAAMGFRDIEAQFFAPIAKEAKLKRLENIQDATDQEKYKLEIYNRNIDILNNLLFGPQDYAVMGKK